MKSQKRHEEEKALYLEKEKYKELKEREERLANQRARLESELNVQRDYYSLGLFHKFIILGLFSSLSLFIIFLILSYHPSTKNHIFKLLGYVI